MNKAKCYNHLHEVSNLMHYRKWTTDDDCGVKLSKKLKEIIKLLKKQEEHKY